jgi:phosphohistidine phosphatase
MQIALLRHAPAEERDPARWPDDARRPLTRIGRGTARRAALGLKSLGVRPTRIVSSPALRCADTARIVAIAFPGTTVELWPELSFDGTPERAVARLVAPGPRNGTVLMVGHEPGLGRTVGYLVFGESISALRLKRAGAALLEVPRRPGPSAARLEWLLTRRQLTSMASRAE